MSSFEKRKLESSEFYQKVLDTIPSEEPEPSKLHYQDVRGWVRWMMKQWIKVEVDKENKIGYIIWNRPEKLNAGCPFAASQAAFEMKYDEETHVLVMKGNGRAFGAGYDITPVVGYGMSGKRSKYREPTGVSRDRNPVEILLDNDYMCVNDEWYYRCLWKNPKPIIAQVHGFCLAGACHVVSNCDIVYASEDAVFGHPVLRQLGGGSLPVCPPYLYGLRKSKEIAFSGNLVSAQEAYNLGAVNKVLPREKLEEETFYYAKAVATLPLAQVSGAKDGLNSYYDTALNTKKFREDSRKFNAPMREWKKMASETEYGSGKFWAAAGSKGLSFQLRARDSPFAEVDRWWRKKLASRPKFEKGRLEEGWEERKEVIEKKKKN
jgi:enoyl-CoA hydratase